MKKVPYAFQDSVRTVYFNLLKRFVEDEGLSLDLENFDEDAIISPRFLREPKIVAIIDSHSHWGTPDAFTNESTPRGLNERTYNGLKIIIKDNKYKDKIDKIADLAKSWLEEDVIVEWNDQEINIKNIELEMEIDIFEKAC